MSRSPSRDRSEATEVGKPTPRCLDAFYIRPRAIVRCELERFHVGVHEGGGRRWYSGLPFDSRKAS